ncbi:MAG: hypothetical protein IT372_08860, partial [Polyangiaceae bacterium]|nr:hypothetical protein [Polyangiaceae bacterium]
MQTFEGAISRARSGNTMRIYACAETFSDAVMLPSGIDVWGGLDCAQGWRYVGDNRKTVIAPTPDEVPLTVVSDGPRSTLFDLGAALLRRRCSPAISECCENEGLVLTEAGGSSEKERTARAQG